MSNQKNINSFEEALRNTWLQSAKDADIGFSERELKLILSSTDDTFEMDEQKKEALINKIFETSNGPSIGSVISEAMNLGKLSSESMANGAKIPLAMFQQLISDEIFPNNVPVVGLGKILNMLSIQIENARQPIQTTFNIMKAKELRNIDASCRIAARRQQPEGGIGSVNRNGENKGRELFENQEALDKYLQKLEEVMIDSQQ
jgi:hypothetical protein